MERTCYGIWFSGRHGSDRQTVGLNYVGALFQLKWFWDSVVMQIKFFRNESTTLAPARNFLGKMYK